MFIKRTVLLLLFSLLFPIICVGEILADAGKSDYSIVVAKDAIPAEQTAAKELQSFLKQIAGVELPIATQTFGPAIFVGQSPQSAAALEISDWDSMKPDQIVLKTVGGNLYLVGDRPRGSLYAVYELLEREFGVRFWTADAVQVPMKKKIELPKLNYCYAPPFQVRAAGYKQIRAFPAAARMRNNGHGVSSDMKWGGNVSLLGEVHTFGQMISEKRCFQVHPEWFAQRNGKRLGASSQLCLTNPGLRGELTRAVLERLRKFPGTRFISVSQNDNGNLCQCEKCTAFIKAHGTPADLLLDAINEVAVAVGKEFPGVFVETLAYQATRVPPKTVKAADNVVIRYCTIEANSLYSLDSSKNRILSDNLAGWHKAAKHLMIWNYVTNFKKYYLPHPNWNFLASDLRLFRKYGAISIYEQGSWNGGGAVADLADLRAWLVSKLLWNPDLDSDALIEEFVAGYYGQAADAVRSYLRLVNESLARHSDAWGNCYVRSTDSWFDGASFCKAWRALADAYAVYKDDPVYGPRIAAVFASVSTALVERNELFPKQEAARFPELRGVDSAELAAKCVSIMKQLGVSQISEGRTTPDQWLNQWSKRKVIICGEVANDGLPPPVAEGKTCHAWSFGRIGERHAEGRGLFWEDDPTASIGKAVRMPNSHNEWHLQAYTLPHGRFDLYVEARCDSKTPSGDAITLGVYDWNARKEYSQRVPALELNGKKYHAVKIGTFNLKSSMCIFAAPVVNSAVESVWIDRIILIPNELVR